MSDLISIIVPVYNVKNYLEKCVETIINQSYDNLEIILVDDGSTDGSSELCDQLCKKDERIIVLHKQNGGLSDARNFGFSQSKGQYIMFIDSDDYIHEEMVSKLYDAMVTSAADLAICNYDFVDLDGNIVKKNENILKNEVFDKKSAYQKLSEDYNDYYVIACNKLYKREILTNDTFPKGRIHEDEFSIHHIFSKCNYIVSISDVLYFYVQRDNSITHTKLTIKKLDGYLAKMDRYYFFKNKGYEKYAFYALRGAYYTVFLTLKNVDYKENKKELNKAVFEVVKKLKFNPRSAKLLFILLLKKVTSR